MCFQDIVIETNEQRFAYENSDEVSACSAKEKNALWTLPSTLPLLVCQGKKKYYVDTYPNVL